MIKRIFFITIIILVVSVSYGQIFSRIQADFSLKEKRSDGTKSLTMGTVYFDKTANQVVFDVIFPKPHVIVMNDSALIKIVNDKILGVQKISNSVYFSVFNLSLSGDLPYFGLKNTPFQLTDVEKDGDMIISTWEFPELENQGKILLSQKEKNLFGMISYANGDTIASKQFFENYENVNGLNFPTRVVQYVYIAGSENVKITTYKNVIVNNEEAEEYYNYPIPYFE